MSEDKEKYTLTAIASSKSPITIGKSPHNSDTIRIINGRGYDVRQPIPVKYTEVRERYLNARKNLWVPQEIPMGDDKVQWQTHKLTESESWMFKTNISYLTASDNLVPDNLTNAVLERVTASEARQYLRQQIFEESNHIESYQFILESLGLDEQGQGQIFAIYQQMPELIEKLNWSLEFTNNLCDSAYPIGSYEDGQLLLQNLVSYYIFEYLFFPLGFSQVFALSQLGKLRNTAQQYSYIWRDETVHAINNLWLIKQIITENPSYWNKAMRVKARDIVREAVRLEEEYASASMPNGGITGFSVNTYCKYAQFQANMITDHLGIERCFSAITHPCAWMSQYELPNETNFFEGRVREYQSGAGLSWD